MRAIFAASLAGAAGLVAGAMGMSALQAQTAEPQAYLVSNIVEVKDPDLLKKYQAQAPATQVPFGGHALVRAATPQPLPGQSGGWSNAAPPKGAIVIVAFPSMKNLLAWWSSPAYAAVRSQRETATTGVAYAVLGTPPP